MKTEDKGLSSALYNISFKKNITLVKSEYSHDLKKYKTETEVINGAGSLLEIKGSNFLMIALSCGKIILTDSSELISVILDDNKEDQ